jgi:hypothetical protein
MTRDSIRERLIGIGFIEGQPGFGGMDGDREQTFRHSSRVGVRSSVHVSDDRLIANGLYADELATVPPTGKNWKGKPYWEGEALEAALQCLEQRYLPKSERLSADV